MKKHLLKSLLALALVLITGNAWGEEKSFDITISNFTEITNSYTTKYTHEYDVDGSNVGVEAYGVYKNSNGIQMNSGKGTYIKNTTAIPGNITKIVVKWSATGKNSPTLYVNKGGVASTNSTNLGKGSNTVIEQTYTVDNPSASQMNYFYFDGTTVTGACYAAITVYYESVSSGTLSSIAVSGQTTSFYVGDDFKFGGTVTASYEETDADDADVTNKATFSGYDMDTTGEQTVTVSYTEGEATKTATYEITVNAIPEKTIAEFISSEGGKCYLTGIVSNIANTTYGNFDLTDESGTIYVYGCLNSNGEEKKFSTLDVVAGDKIKVLANEYILYGEKDEAVNVIFVEEIAIEKAKYVVTIEIPTNGTLVVKDGENTIASGDEIEEGTVLTIEATPADGYKLRNWQAVDGSTHTYTTTFIYTIAQSAVTISANFDPIPTYTINYMVNGVNTDAQENVYEGTALVFPTVGEMGGKVFVGWSETEISIPTNEKPTFAETAGLKASADITYYAAFATETEGTQKSEELTNDEIKNLSASALAYTTKKTYEGTDLGYTIYAYTDVANRPWVQLKKDKGVYIKISAPSSITKVDVTITSATNSSGGVADISKHTAFSGTVGLVTTDCAFSTSSENVGVTDEITNNVASIPVTGNASELYLKVSTGARIWGITTYYGTPATYSGYCTTVASPVVLTGAPSKSGYYYATFIGEKNMAVDENTIINTCYVENGVAMLNELDGNVIPANSPVLVYSDNETITLTPTNEEANAEDVEYIEDADFNMLFGYTTDTHVDAVANTSYYALNVVDGNAGFFVPRTTDDPDNPSAANGFTAKAGKAYLKVVGAAPTIGFRFGDATQIENVNIVEAGKYYDLMGREVLNPAGGIYILNGKKVLVK